MTRNPFPNLVSLGTVNFASRGAEGAGGWSTPPMAQADRNVVRQRLIATARVIPTRRRTERNLAGDNLAVGLVIGSFSVSSLLLRPFAGRWADRRGRRIMLIVPRRRGMLRARS